MARIWIGTSGWSYRSWEDAFDPCGLKPEERLGYYADQLFGSARRVLASSDQQAARRLLDDCSRIRKEADQIIAELIGDEDPSLGRAQTAVIALYVRYLKRVGAHLLNILSSVVSPFERIGYRLQDGT